MQGHNFISTPSIIEDLENFKPAYPKDKIFFDDIKYYILNSPSLTLKYQDKTLALGGFVPSWDGVFTSWNLVSTDAKYHKIAVFKAIKTGFSSILKSFADNGIKIRRLQAVVALSRPEAVKLNYILGYRPEAVLRKYNKLEQDCLIMSNIIENPSYSYIKRLP